MLALVLREYSWLNISPKKKYRATRKLQKFFGINEVIKNLIEYFMVYFY